MRLVRLQYLLVVGSLSLSSEPGVAMAAGAGDWSATGSMGTARELHTATLLHNANLSGADLSRATLSGADLSGANLKNANLSKANLIIGFAEEGDALGSGAHQRRLDEYHLPDGTNSDADGGTCAGH
jgi:hypothetical protein